MVGRKATKLEITRAAPLSPSDSSPKKLGEHVVVCPPPSFAGGALGAVGEFAILNIFSPNLNSPLD